MSICSTLKSVNPKSSGGSAPWTPGRGYCPCTPPGALRRAPGPHPKSARAYALAMCAPAHMFAPPKKSARSLRARYVRSAHMFAQNKSDPSNSKKIGSRFALAIRAHVCPPIINRCPLLAPPLFKSWCRHCQHTLSRQAPGCLERVRPSPFPPRSRNPPIRDKPGGSDIFYPRICLPITCCLPAQGGGSFRTC